MAALTRVSLVDWLLVALAVYRLAYLTTIDNGPARVFARFRMLVVRRFGPASWQAEFASCFFCQSVWYAAAGALVFAPGTLVEFLVLWLSLAGAAAVLHWWVLERMAAVNR